MELKFDMPVAQIVGAIIRAGEDFALQVVKAIARSLPQGHSRIVHAVISDYWFNNKNKPLNDALPVNAVVDDKRICYRTVAEVHHAKSTPALTSESPSTVSASDAPNIASDAHSLRDRFVAVVVNRHLVGSIEKFNSLVVTGDENLHEVLGMDSLDDVELVLALEDEFNVEIDDDTAEYTKTLNSALVTIHNLMHGKTEKKPFREGSFTGTY